MRHSTADCALALDASNFAAPKPVEPSALLSNGINRADRGRKAAALPPSLPPSASVDAPQNCQFIESIWRRVLSVDNEHRAVLVLFSSGARSTTRPVMLYCSTIAAVFCSSLMILVAATAQLCLHGGIPIPNRPYCDCPRPYDGDYCQRISPCGSEFHFPACSFLLRSQAISAAPSCCSLYRPIFFVPLSCHIEFSMIAFTESLRFFSSTTISTFYRLSTSTSKYFSVYGVSVLAATRCKCDDNWIGENCTMRHCVNGRLMADNRCDCSKGYTGEFCTSVDKCINGELQNGR